MCRLFAFSFNKDTKKDHRVFCVNSFKSLSLHGAVLPTSVPGHGDGWGIVVYPRTENVAPFYKSVDPAHLDQLHKTDLFFEEGISQSGLIHLRKKTVGDTSLSNTHPFVEGAYSFIHNGTICHADAYPELAPLCAGGTDSERLFRRFLEIKKYNNQTTLSAFKQMLQEVRSKYPKYSALNTILHDGEKIYVSRSITMNTKNFSDDDLLNYYSLYLGETLNGDVIVSSEKLQEVQVVYMLLPNNSLSSIDISNNSVMTELLD